jgi:hypothetical protein
VTRSPTESQQTVEATLDDICPAAYAVDCDLPEHANVHAARAALRDLVAQVEQWERLALDMGEAIREMCVDYRPDDCPRCSLLARLDALGKDRAASRDDG